MSKIWSEEEEEVVRRMYPTEDVTVIAKQVGRTIHAVRCKASILGIKRSDFIWSEQDTLLLQKHYPSMELAELSKLLQRTVLAINNMAFKLGIERQKRNPITNEPNIYVNKNGNFEVRVGGKYVGSYPSIKKAITARDKAIKNRENTP